MFANYKIICEINIIQQILLIIINFEKIIIMTYGLCILLFLIGLYAVVTKRNLIKIVIGFIIMENAVNLLLIMLGYRLGGRAPIIWKNAAGAADLTGFANSSVDPLPQALVLTSIVISLGVTALMVAICLRVYQRYGTFDISKIRRLKG